MFQLRFNNCTLACRLVSCDTMFGFWLADGFYPDDFLQGFHRESTTYFERQYIYVQLLTSILMTRPTITECNHRSRSHYQTRDPRALTVTWVYQTRDPRSLTVTWVYQTRHPLALTVTWVYQTRDPRALPVTWVYQTRDPRALTVT